METMDQEVLEELIVESQEHLADIEPDLLSMESGLVEVDPEIINRVFRGIHSIKGGFGFLGVEPVQRLAHAMESVLMKVRDGELAMSSEMVDVMLAGVDRIREMMNDVDAAGEVDSSAVFSGLQPWLDGSTPPQVPAPTPEVSQMSEPVAPKKSGLIPLSPKIKIAAAAAKGESASTPTNSAAKPEPAVKKPTAQDAKARHQGSDVLRVKVDLLNQLMNQAGELVLARNQMVQALDRKLSDSQAGQGLVQALLSVVEDSQRSLKNNIADMNKRISVDGTSYADLLDREYTHLADRIKQAMPSRLSELPGMNANMVNLDSVTTALQENIMRTRMQNMDTLFGKLPRQVRDLSRKTGREVYLEVSGREVELDKSIIEALSDPLNHMIRNSLDHGIEPPEEREAAGKSRSGRLAVRAFHESGQVNIEITDDGRGIDPEKIKSIALKKGVITEDQAAAMDDHEAVMLIMAPGFSTAEKVSDISGRGVGMDVVRSNIESLGGTVDVESKPGQGSVMRLKLPLTLAIIPSLLVKVAGRRFAVPQVGLDELVRLRRGEEQSNIEKVQDSEVMRLRGKLLPLVRMEDLLGIERQENDDSRRAENILVLKLNENRYGLVVDEVLDSEEIVVKPLPGMLKDSPSYAGATIMGDGGVAMILDVVGIAEEAGLRFTESDLLSRNEEQNVAYLERTESQTLLLFRNHPDELFALDLAMVARIEAVPRDQIQRIGDQEYLNYETNSLRLVRMHDYMPVTAPESDQEELFIIIPKIVKHPIGIVVTNCEDVVTLRTQLDRGTMGGTGILGTMVLNKELIIFLDIYALFEAAAPEIYQGVQEGPRNLDGLRILLAEDTAFFRAMVTKYVSSLGYEVDVVKDGNQAWEKLNANPNTYDLLLTDIEMPIMDGIELTKKVRASEALAKLPIITLTSLTSDEMREACFAAGVNAHEWKLDKERLANTVRRVASEAVQHG